MTVLDGRAWLLACQEIPCFGQAQPRKTLKEMNQVEAVKVNQFRRRYKSGDCKKYGQKLDGWIFNERSMVNSAKRHSHLTVRQHVSILSCDKSGDYDPVCPADVEVR